MTEISGSLSGGLWKGQSPRHLLGGPSGFLSRRCRGLRPCVDTGPEREDSYPVLKCLLGYFWSLPMGVRCCLEWGHALPLSFQAVAAVSRILSHGSRDLWLSPEAFPRSFPMRLSQGLSHVPPWFESILGEKVEAVQGKQVSLKWTETSGVSELEARTWNTSRLSCGEPILLRCDWNAGNSFPTSQGKDP